LYEKHGYYPNYFNVGDWNIFIPSQYDTAEKEMKQYCDERKGIYVNGIYGMDDLSSKLALYEALLRAYSRDVVLQLIPYTLKMNEISDGTIDEDKIYIFKKNIQRQEGLYVSDKKDEIMKLAKSGEYEVIQEFLRDPFIVVDTFHSDGKKITVKRKINMRIYTLVVIRDGKMNVYIYRNGFLYYTPDSFEYARNVNFSKDKDKMITTGYIDRSVYRRNPLTLSDFRRYSMSQGHNYDLFWNIVKMKFGTLFEAYRQLLEEMNGGDNVYYQIFGADIEPNSRLDDLRIFEFNKGPDLGAKDGRDKMLKDRMFDDSLKVVLNESDFHNFDEVNFRS
jgi:hypothetical protein